MASWSEVDSFGCFVSGPAWAAERIRDSNVKAMSWALRRLGTVDPEAARNFIAQHKGQLASRIVREVSRKLETGRKDGRRTKARSAPEEKISRKDAKVRPKKQTIHRRSQRPQR